ncbi:hypothetical protein Hanom_Chr04g00319831 [Helianthus anomalus]
MYFDNPHPNYNLTQKSSQILSDSYITVYPPSSSAHTLIITNHHSNLKTKYQTKTQNTKTEKQNQNQNRKHRLSCLKRKLRGGAGSDLPSNIMHATFMNIQVNFSTHQS